MMKKTIVTYIFLLGIALVGYSQQNELESVIQDTTSYVSDIEEQQDNFDFNVSTGMSFSSFGKGMGATGTYLYPNANMKIGEKWNLKVGTYFLRSNFTGISSQELSVPGIGYNPAAGNQFNSGFINAAATYEVSSKINVSGYMMKGFGDSNNSMILQNYYSNMSLMGIGVSYEILPNLSIGAEFNYSSSPSYYSPFTPGYYHPFSSPFNNRIP